jgi:hypothetical protein
MVDHTNQVVANIINETAFGSGFPGGAAAYDEHAAANNEGDPMQAPYMNGNITMPLAVKNRLFKPQVGANMGSVQVFDNGLITAPQTFSQFIQSDRWPDAIINGYDVAAVPKDGFSKAVHWENAANVLYDIFGVMPIKWLLTLDRGENDENQPFPKQDTTVTFYNSATSAIGYDADAGFSGTQPLVNNDIAITLDKNGAGAIDLKWSKAVVMIEAILNKKGEFGQDNIKYPFAIDYNIEIDLTFRDYNAILLETTLAVASLGDWDFSIDFDKNNLTTPVTKNILTMDNMFVKESNVSELPEFGLFEYTLNLVPGDTFVHTTDLLLASG